jgi:hypothetical protein
MLFSEIYGSYFNVVAAALAEATCGALTGKRLQEIIREKAFSESVLFISDSLKNGAWPLFRENFGTPIRHRPTMPLTILQKRWLKTLLSDPRIRLFDPPIDGLEDIEPLYAQDVFFCFDRYTDGDPYTDEAYIAHFRAILTGLREKRRLRVRFESGVGRRHTRRVVPYSIEYSSKDDKFRLIAAEGFGGPINIARISACELAEPYAPEEAVPPRYRMRTLVLELLDERNALERAMLHFSHLEKETERLSDEARYRITLKYNKEDETEMLIRVLAFGPLLRVLSPAGFVDRMRERLRRQKELDAGE